MDVQLLKYTLSQYQNTVILPHCSCFMKECIEHLRLVQPVWQIDNHKRWLMTDSSLLMIGGAKRVKGGYEVSKLWQCMATHWIQIVENCAPKLLLHGITSRASLVTALKVCHVPWHSETHIKSDSGDSSLFLVLEDETSPIKASAMVHVYKYTLTSLASAWYHSPDSHFSLPICFSVLLSMQTEEQMMQ